MPLLPCRIWTDEEWLRIQAGYHSYDMDEKWDVITHDHAVFIYRSWTGHQLFEASFIAIPGGRQIDSALIESNPERWDARDRPAEYDCILLELALSNIVLGEPATDLRQRLVELIAATTDTTKTHPHATLHSVLGLRTSTEPPT